MMSLISINYIVIVGSLLCPEHPHDDAIVEPMQVTGGVWAPLEISSRPPVVVEEGSNGSLGESDVEILSFANRSREMLEDIDDSGAGATPGSGVVELRSPTRL
jgi:hypothetical protein